MAIVRKLLGMFSKVFASDLGIDLGTAYTLVYAKNRGIVMNEPSVVALTHNKGSYIPCAFGHTAKMMLGKTPSGIRAIRPLKDGVIADFKASEEMIKYFIRSVNQRRTFNNPNIIICVPSGSTPVERRAIQDAAESAGANKVYLIEEPMAAALGANLPVTEPLGSMIVDIGGGTTEIAVISLGGIVYSRSVRVGGDAMDEAIISYVRKNYNLLIGEATAERIKKTIGTACISEDYDLETIEVRGRDLLQGLPKEIILNSQHVSESLSDAVSTVVAAIKEALENIKPELISDIFKSGITLSGGGALLTNLPLVINKFTDLDVTVADNPLCSVALGIGTVLENLDKFRHVLFTQD